MNRNIRTIPITFVGILSLLSLGACTEILIGSFNGNNPVDPGGGRYQGFETVDDPSEVITHSNGRIWPVFTVSKVLGAHVYHLQIAATEEFSADSIIHDGAHYESNMMRPVGDFGLVAETEYFWRGRVSNGTFGSWTEARSFIMESLPGRNPANGAVTIDSRPVVSWDSVPGGAFYELQFAEHFAEVLDAERIEISATSAEFPFDVERGVTGYWRIRVRDESDVYGAWSVVSSMYPPYEVGDRGPAGGWIFYVDEADDFHWTFLEAAPASTEWTTKPWGGYGTIVGTTEWAIGAGEDNTLEIVATYGRSEPYENRSDYAAILTDNLVHNGFSDWFLPSINELLKIKDNLHNNNIGDFTGHNSTYWSSSEKDREYAYSYDFRFDRLGSWHRKNGWARVRAVRSF